MHAITRLSFHTMLLLLLGYFCPGVIEDFKYYEVDI